MHMLNNAELKLASSKGCVSVSGEKKGIRYLYSFLSTDQMRCENSVS